MKKLLFIAVLVALLILTVVPAFAAERACPRGFKARIAAPSDPDRNGDGLVCVQRIVPSGRISEVIIDNNIPSSVPSEGCGQGFDLVATFPQDPIDKNGDKKVCKKAVGEGFVFIDNNIP